DQAEGVLRRPPVELVLGRHVAGRNGGRQGRPPLVEARPVDRGGPGPGRGGGADDRVRLVQQRGRGAGGGVVEAVADRDQQPRAQGRHDVVAVAGQRVHPGRVGG